MKKQSFTLLELCLITGIVLFAVTLFIPGLSAAADQDSETMCRSNLKDITTAFQQYATDYDGYYPGFFKTSGKNRTWSRILVTDTNYLLGPAVLSCPANPSPDGAARRKAASAIWDFCCYGFYAGNISADDWDYGKRVRGALGDFARGAVFSESYTLKPDLMKQPAQTVFLADSAKFSGSHSPNSYISPRAFYQESAVNTLHENRANTVTADGAITARSAAELAETPLRFSAFVNGNFEKEELTR